MQLVITAIAVGAGIGFLNWLSHSWWRNDFREWFRLLFARQPVRVEGRAEGLSAELE